MTFWRTFHSINEDMAFVVGLGLNVLLLYLIKKVRVKSMQQYNILLLQCCCIDLFQVFISFIVKPALVVHKKNLYYLSNGFVRPIGGSVEMLGIIMWVISVFFCINSMPVSYVFRYKIVCLNSEISKKFYVISLIVAFLSASTFGMIMWKFHYLDTKHLIYMAEEGFSWLIADDEGKVKAASVCPTGTFGMLFSILDASVITFIPYSIMIIYHVRIMNYLKYHKNCLTAASRRVQNNLNRILLVQAIIPIFFAFLPVGFHIFSVIVDYNLVFETFIAGIMYCWIPTGNAICVLFFVTAYRRKLGQLIFRGKKRMSHVFSVSGTMIAES